MENLHQKVSFEASKHIEIQISASKFPSTHQGETAPHLLQRGAT